MDYWDLLLDDTYKEVRKAGLGRGHTQMTCAAAAIKALVNSVGSSGAGIDHQYCPNKENLAGPLYLFISTSTLKKGYNSD